MITVQNVRHGHCDSFLELVAGDLQLTLEFNIRLVKINPGHHSVGGLVIGPRTGVALDPNSGRRYNLLRWSESEWSTFTARFEEVILNAWDGKLWLHPDRAWYSENPTSPLRASRLSCRIRLNLSTGDPQIYRPHGTFYCVKETERLPRNSQRSQEPLRSYVRWGRNRDGVITQNDVYFITNYFPQGDDTNPRLRPGVPLEVTPPYTCTQIVATHEFGHLMLLDHVREGMRGCHASHDTVACYGLTRAERDDIMGSGDVVGPQHSIPWTNALARHLTPENNHDRGITWEASNLPSHFMTYASTQ